MFKNTQCVAKLNELRGKAGFGVGKAGLNNKDSKSGLKLSKFDAAYAVLSVAILSTIGFASVCLVG